MIKVGIDIGNSKISCVVSDFKSKDTINILSIKSLPSVNINKNTILNYDEFLNQLKTIILESEKNSQTKIKSINLSIPLFDHIIKYYSSEINLHNEKISNLHLNKLVNQSEYFETESNFTNILNYIISYEIDHKNVSSIPYETFAENIKLIFIKLMIKAKIIQNYSDIFKKIDLYVENFIPSPISSSLAVITRDEKELGSICIDLGHSNTSITIFENNKCIYSDSFSIGSNNITNDIARGVSTTISSAERLKTLYGSLVSSPSDDHEIIEIPIISGDKNTFKQITRSNLNAIIRPRIEETLELIWQKIRDNNLRNKKLNNVVLTGGGAMMDNITKYVETIFASGVRVSNPLDQLNLENNFKKPNFCDIIGSILYDRDLFKIDFLANRSKNLKKRGISGFFTWLDQYI